MQAGDIVRYASPHWSRTDWSSSRPGVILSVRGTTYNDSSYVRWVPWEDKEGFDCIGFDCWYLNIDLVVVDPEEAVLLRLAYPELCGS